MFEFISAPIDIEARDGESAAPLGILQRFANRTDAAVESAQNYQTGLAIVGVGLVFVLLSTLFLPFFLIKPYKFCALYSLGTITVFVGVVVMNGRAAWKSLFGRRNAPLTLLFLASFCGEFYFAAISASYFLALFFLVAHTLSALYLLSAVIPNGARGLNALFAFVFGAARQVFALARG